MTATSPVRARRAAKRAPAQIANYNDGTGVMTPGTTTPPTPQPLAIMPDWADGDGPYGAATTRYNLTTQEGWPALTGPQTFIATDELAHVGTPVNAWMTTSEFPWDVGGEPGLVGRLGYTLGPAYSGSVEDFELTGRIVRVRRPAEGIPGPVATADYMANYLSAYAQSSYRATPDALLYPDIGSNI